MSRSMTLSISSNGSPAKHEVYGDRTGFLIMIRIFKVEEKKALGGLSHVICLRTNTTRTTFVDSRLHSSLYNLFIRSAYCSLMQSINSASGLRMMVLGMETAEVELTPPIYTRRASLWSVGKKNQVWHVTICTHT